MRITQIHTLPDGRSEFGEVALAMSEAAFAPPAAPFRVGERQPADRYLFFEMPAGWVGEWHPAPARQLAVVLAGELEVEVGTGERRRFAPGGVVLLGDFTGEGHRTRVVGDHDVRGLFVQLPTDAAAPY